MDYYKMMFDGSKKRDDDIMARPYVGIKDSYIVFDGVFISDWNDDFAFWYDPKEGHLATDFLGNVYGWQIFSERALKLFGDIISNDIQLLPTKVINRDTGQETGKYFVVNVLPLLDALDLENSVYNYHGPKDVAHLSVIKYGIKKEKVAGHHIFRLRDSKFSLFVSGEFKKVVEENKMLGRDFLKIKSI